MRSSKLMMKLFSSMGLRCKENRAQGTEPSDVLCRFDPISATLIQMTLMRILCVICTPSALISLHERLTSWNHMKVTPLKSESGATTSLVKRCKQRLTLQRTRNSEKIILTMMELLVTQKTSRSCRGASLRGLLVIKLVDSAMNLTSL